MYSIIFIGLGASFLAWAFSVYFSVLTTSEEKPNIPQLVREPLDGKKWSQYDYTTGYKDPESNIFFFMFAVLTSALVAPYETLIYEMSEDPLLVGQELNHAQIQTNWNRFLEKDMGYPVWSFWQIKVWKNLMFNYLRPLGQTCTLCVGVALEALFCWIIYCYKQFRCSVYKTLTFKSWVWDYHLLEEVEHTHISVPEMRETISLPLRILTWLVFDFLIVVPLMLPLTIFETVRLFPRRVFCPRGLYQLLLYVTFCLIAIPFCAMGQFCELVLCLNWKAAALEDLHHTWVQNVYNTSCKGLFKHEEPNKYRKCVKGAGSEAAKMADAEARMMG